MFVSERLPSGAHFTIPPITADMVKAYLPKIPANKATGIDVISCALLRLGITELAPSIAKLVNLSLSRETFPCRWKQARVSAVDTLLFKVTRPSFFFLGGGVPSYFEALWYPTFTFIVSLTYRMDQ